MNEWMVVVGFGRKVGRLVGSLAGEDGVKPESQKLSPNVEVI